MASSGTPFTRHRPLGSAERPAAIPEPSGAAATEVARKAVDAGQCGARAEGLCSFMAVYPLPNEWRSVSIAPEDTELEVGVMGMRGVHALVFPCRKRGHEWIDTTTGLRLDIQPTHWRKWTETL